MDEAELVLWISNAGGKLVGGFQTEPRAEHLKAVEKFNGLAVGFDSIVVALKVAVGVPEVEPGVEVTPGLRSRMMRSSLSSKIASIDLNSLVASNAAATPSQLPCPR